MQTVNDECVGCPDGIPCLGRTCPFKNVVRYYCDKCGEENKLYEFDGEQLCIDCIAKLLPVVEGSE